MELAAIGFQPQVDERMFGNFEEGRYAWPSNTCTISPSPWPKVPRACGCGQQINPGRRKKVYLGVPMTLSFHLSLFPFQIFNQQEVSWPIGMELRVAIIFT